MVRSFRRAALVHGTAWAGLAGLATAVAWRGPAANLYPATALGLALVLDGAGRIMAAGLARRPGPDPRLSGLPSLVLGIGRPAGLWLAAAALLLFPRAIPVLASALAGLIAIGAFARLALIRTVLGCEREAAATLPSGDPSVRSASPPFKPALGTTMDNDRWRRRAGTRGWT